MSSFMPFTTFKVVTFTIYEGLAYTIPYLFYNVHVKYNTHILC